MKIKLNNTTITLVKPRQSLDKQFFEKEAPIIKKRNIDKFGLRRRIVFLMDGYKYAAHAVKKRWGIDVYFFEAGHGLLKSVYMDTSMNKQAAELWSKKMNEEENFMQLLEKGISDIVKIQKKLVASIPKNEISPKQAEKLITDYLDYWLKFWEPGLLWFCIENIKEKIDDEIRSSFVGTKDEADQFIDKVYRPIKHPRSSEEQRELLDMGALKGQALDVALNKHWKKYKHLAMHDSIGDTPFDIEDFRERLKITNQKEEYKKAKESLKSADAEIKIADELLKKTKLSPILKRKIKFVRSFMFIRTETIDYMTMVFEAYQNVFHSLSNIFSLPFDAVLNMTFDEILSSLKNKKLSVPRNIILERTKNGYAFLITPRNSYLVVGEEVDQLLDVIDDDRNKEKPSELKGQVAFPGKVSGKARVIIDSKHVNEVEEGEILITTMTNPSYVPAMKRSAGMITNEGGVLCHAAIMSRELRKPCVIGTKFATDVFSTGDLVEVDATTGIVRKIT